jgi:hypothetical protein
MSQCYFYQSFLDLGNVTPTYPKELDDADFRKFLIEKAGPSPEVVSTLAPALQRRIIKPQHLLYDDPDYYVCVDQLTNTYYICFRTLLMVDLDFYKDPTLTPAVDTPIDIKAQPVIDRLTQYCAAHPEVKFSVYASQNGLHAFLVSRPMDYRSVEARELMIELKCDFFYIVYAYLRGWSVRLNRKKREMSSDQPIYRHLSDIGTGMTDEYLAKLVQLHLNLTQVFGDVAPCLMYGG